MSNSKDNENVILATDLPTVGIPSTGHIANIGRVLQVAALEVVDLMLQITEAILIDKDQGRSIT